MNMNRHKSGSVSQHGQPLQGGRTTGWRAAAIAATRLSRRRWVPIAIMLAVSVWPPHNALPGPKADRDAAADREDEPSDDEPAAPRVNSLALRTFEQFASGADNTDRLRLLLEQKISSVDLICGLTGSQREKLRLAGGRDVAQLLEGIERRRKELQAVGDGKAQPDLEQIRLEGRRLAESIFQGPYGDGSLFAKSLRGCLAARQLEAYDEFFRNQRKAIETFSQLTDRLQAATQPAGVGEIVEINLSSTRAADDALALLANMTALTKLGLASTRITNSGLVHLIGLEHLQALNRVPRNTAAPLSHSPFLKGG